MWIHARGRTGLAVAAAVALGLGTLAAPAPARANLRAPIVDSEAPSSAAFAPDGADGLVVAGETLVFRCAAGRACEVEARYRIRAAAAIATELTFVLPVATPVTARVGAAGGAPVAVKVAPTSPARQGSVTFAEGFGLGRAAPPAFEARFAARFAAGDNDVVVGYRQPLGRWERDHGYFRRSRYADFFRYEIWPISEWKHAPGFRIDGYVQVHRPAPSWWKRTFGTPRSLGCEGLLDEHRDAALEQHDDDLRYVFRLTDPLPKRLLCFIGDEDLVPPPH